MGEGKMVEGAGAGAIHIVDDDEAMRDSLSFLLGAAGLDVVTHGSAESLLVALPELDFACIVTDVRMPGLSGLDLLRRLRERDKQLPVIVMTGHSDVPMAVEAMKAGAHDFIEKPFDDERIVSAVREALSARDEARSRSDSRAEIVGLLAGLSARERQVLDGLVAGQRNKVIARELGISPRTVEIYRANLMSKLNASSLSDVVRMAMIAQTEAGEP